MESSNSNIPEKTNREILLDFLKESVGVERGLVKTFIDLRKKPIEVLDGYLKGDNHYVSPFKLLFGGLALWLFINSFIIDWYKIFGSAMQDYINFLSRIILEDSRQKAKFDSLISPIMDIFVNFAGDLFTKIYVPFVICVIPLSAYFASRLTKDFKVSYKTLLSVNSYVMGANVFVYLIMSVTAAINFYVFIVLCFVLLSLALVGHNLMMLVPPRRFFTSDGLIIEKKMLKANFYSVGIFMTIIGIGYFLWFYFIIKLFGQV